MSDVNVLLCAVDSAMNTLAAFDRDRADVTARVSFALSSVLARVALEPSSAAVRLQTQKLLPIRTKKPAIRQKTRRPPACAPDWTPWRP